MRRDWSCRRVPEPGAVAIDGLAHRHSRQRLLLAGVERWVEIYQAVGAVSQHGQALRRQPGWVAAAPHVVEAAGAGVDECVPHQRQRMRQRYELGDRRQRA